MRYPRTWLLLSLGLGLAGCREAAPKVAEIRPVRTIVVDPKPITDDRQAVGEVRPRYESDLGFRVAGKVIARTIDVGATVKKGDVLARLDSEDFANKLKSASADIVAADATLHEAKAKEWRLRQLLASGTTTRANYEVALRDLRSAEARVSSSKAAMDLAKDQLRYAELVADFDGIVTAVAADAGQVVGIGQTIVKLARPNERDAVFSIAESALSDRSSNSERPRLSVLLLSNPGISADAIVREVSPVADPTTRTFQVKATLMNAPEQMRFGGSVVGLLKSNTEAVVVLPGSALFDKGGQPAVWVVDPGCSCVALKPVRVARYETDRVVISHGLAKGDRVVTAGVHQLRENQKVRLTEGASL